MLPILVTGATGRIGRLVVDQLLLAGAPVRALTRRPLDAALPPQAEVVSGDFTEPESLEHAFDGIDALFLVWTAPLATASAIIELAASRVRRIVLLSSPHQTPHPFFQQPNPLAKVHAEIDRLVMQSGVETVIIRPGMFASNVRLWWAAMIREHGAVPWPFAASESAPIDERDIAAVAARALIDPRHAGADWVLTGPESISQAAQLAIIAEATGQSLTFEELSPDQFRQATAGRWPPAAVEMLLAAWEAAIGHPAFLSSAVQDVLGRPPRSFRDWAVDNRTAFLP